MSRDWTIMRVQSTPRITDPKELHTIVLCSLESLFGKLQSHSIGLKVTVDGSDLFVQCRTESTKQVRAALTMVTPPPYLEDTVYCIDVLEKI